jgi:hypothetical protein
VRNSPVALAYGDFGDDLCPRVALEQVLVRNPVDYAEHRDHWRSVVELARRGNFARVVQDRGGVNLADPPEGNSWERWAEWVDHRLSEVADDPTSVAALPRHPEPWQVRSGELDEGVEGLVRSALSKTAMPVGSSRRDYVVVDLTEPVGSAAQCDPRTGVLTERATHRLGVVVERTDRVRVVGLHAADPEEDPRASSWRARWPVLSAAAGGWFSQAGLGSRTPWGSQSLMLEQESDEHLERLAAEGAELLALGDEDLHAAVRALGCYVEPSYLRLWLEWMFWRIGYFDWK